MLKSSSEPGARSHSPLGLTLKSSGFFWSPRSCNLRCALTLLASLCLPQILLICSARSFRSASEQAGRIEVNPLARVKTSLQALNEEQAWAQETPRRGSFRSNELQGQTLLLALLLTWQGKNISSDIQSGKCG